MDTLKNILLTILLFALSLGLSAQKEFILKSPDSKLQAKIIIDKEAIKYTVIHDGDIMVGYSQISLSLADGRILGDKPQLSKSSAKIFEEVIQPPIYKRKEIESIYNELYLKFKGDFDIVFRAFDEAIAYKFVLHQKDPYIVEEEVVEFNFPADTKAYIPYAKGREKNKFDDQFYSSFQNIYEHVLLSQWNKDRVSFLPLVVEGANGKKICITEADLLNYPGLYLHNKDNSTTLKGVFPAYPKKIVQEVRGLKGVVRDRESYIARMNPSDQFPWRVIIVSENDYELADSDIIYKLASPSKVTDPSWIKPGKVAWEWWNDWNIYGVDFEAGINNETYRYYIDFASKYGIEYVILDEGWSVHGEADLMKVIPEIDIPGLVAYAKERNVGIILWAGYFAFDKDMDNVSRHYAAMGVKGFKIDFMDRDDQLMIDFNRRAAETGAKYNLLIDIHGTSKPTGLQRTYPNVVNFEGVHGLEEMKWAKDSTDQVTYDVTLPFIRMVAGPLDYTQGAMRNAIRKNFRSIYTEPMSQGTRCRQLAEYVIFESPLNMLCDTPSNYEKEPECTKFIAEIPTVWDQTIALNGEIAKYITIARQKDGVWYLGSLTNWDARELDLDLSFLGEGKFKAEIFRDGVNAHKAARDYKEETINIASDKRIKIKMAPGGGFVAKIYKDM
ncbi:alpha-glucosidase [Dysgonomonas hofstadii]|uniref:Alpha-glucosidase n=1 Tax=Dysgonomonas hofstadii TaxID=637886 RepID=A0A840CQR6_9BACT|nr:glycoside hydrolase family 97 protein [Dysgonomonas hofstadii]MBB4037391.1 alpha-glucosidase [Dysgonomonas hofstadii]